MRRPPRFARDTLRPGTRNIVVLQLAKYPPRIAIIDSRNLYKRQPLSAREIYNCRSARETYEFSHLGFAKYTKVSSHRWLTKYTKEIIQQTNERLFATASLHFVSLSPRRCTVCLASCLDRACIVSRIRPSALYFPMAPTSAMVSVSLSDRLRSLSQRELHLRPLDFSWRRKT